MDRLNAYGTILDYCEQGLDYSELWFELFHQSIDDGTKKLTLHNVIQNVATLEFELKFAIFENGYNELSVEDFIKKYSIDEQTYFFDIVRDVIKKGGIVRIEEPLKNSNFAVGKRTSIAYTQIIR